MGEVSFLAALGTGRSQTSADIIGSTSHDIPELKGIDDCMLDFLHTNEIPGGSLSVVQGGRLVFTKAYGWADERSRLPMNQEMLFRIASVSKTITSVAVMRLIETHTSEITMETPVFRHIRFPGSSPRVTDERLWQITIRNLLQHSGGWDRKVSGDPMFKPFLIAKALNIACPPSARDIVRYMMGQPLDFSPGERQAYSNFGYCVLGRLIEDITGQTYEAYVQAILATIGIHHMRIGASLARAPGEVTYYEPAVAPVPPVFPAIVAKQVPIMYGGCNVEALDSHGGWLASTVQLARFIACLDVPIGPPLLKPSTCEMMYAPPKVSSGVEHAGQPGKSFYACGWNVAPQRNGKAHYWHGGHLWGASGRIVRLASGMSYAVMLNRGFPKGPVDWNNITGDAITLPLERALTSVKEWPKTDLFPRFIASA